MTDQVEGRALTEHDNGALAGRGRRGLLVLALAVCGLLIATGVALAATGALTPQGCISDVGDPANCGTTQQGLRDAQDVAVSTDGASVYVVSFVDDAIVRFDRNTATGALTGQGCIADIGSLAGCGTGQQGLNGARGDEAAIEQAVVTPPATYQQTVRPDLRADCG